MQKYHFHYLNLRLLPDIDSRNEKTNQWGGGGGGLDT